MEIGQALRDAGALIDLLVFARDKGDLLDQLVDVVGHFRGEAAALAPALLARDGDAFVDGLRVVGANLRTHAVFERRNDLAARRVVLRVGAEDERDIEREAHRVALNLHIAFLHDVEERDLDFAGEVGQLVHGEDAAVGAGKQAIVHRQLV